MTIFPESVIQFIDSLLLEEELFDLLFSFQLPQSRTKALTHQNYVNQKICRKIVIADF
jgi:hypothetical protein